MITESVFTKHCQASQLVQARYPQLLWSCFPGDVNTYLSCWTSENPLPATVVPQHLTLFWLFSSVPWPIRSSGAHKGRFNRAPLPVSFCMRPLWAVLAWAGMSTLWCCPSSISSANHGVVYPPRCSERLIWRGCNGVWHVPTMQVSVSWQLPEEVPVDPEESWCWFASSRSSCEHWVLIIVHETQFKNSV